MVLPNQCQWSSVMCKFISYFSIVHRVKTTVFRCPLIFCVQLVACSGLYNLLMKMHFPRAVLYTCIFSIDKI